MMGFITTLSYMSIIDFNHIHLHYPFISLFLLVLYFSQIVSL